MPFAFIIIGIVLLIVAARNQHSQFFTLLANDFVGPNNFVFWAAAILAVGSVGYIPKLKPLSVAFIVLTVIVLVLTRGNPNSTGGGFFQQLLKQLNSTQSAKYTASPSSSSGSSNGQGFQSLANAFSFVNGSPASSGSVSNNPFWFASDANGLNGQGPGSGVTSGIDNFGGNQNISYELPDLTLPKL